MLRVARKGMGCVRPSIAFAVCLLALMHVPGARAGFQVGLDDLNYFQPPTDRFAFGAMRTVHGSTIRLLVSWRNVAPAGARMPAGFHPRDPADNRYRWRSFDLAVTSATKRHLNVLMTLFQAPAWAVGPDEPRSPDIKPGAWDPSPAQFSSFVHAAAVRYSGHFPDPLHRGRSLPRVKYWEMWNEPNLPYDLAAPNLVGEYRALLNAGYDAVKAVDANDVVSTGGLGPVSFLQPLSVSPLLFAAELMCLQRTDTTFVAANSCPTRARFDIFAHHPYTFAATPTKPAYRYDDVLVGDMGKLSRLLRTADRLHTIGPRIKHHMWVTEWGWPTNSPNTAVGDPGATAARYVAYSMYEMWRSGVQMVIWQTVGDPNVTPLQAGYQVGVGLYTSSRRSKPTLSAFAFPLIASVSGRRGFAWGRAPVSHRVKVVVEHAVGRGWRHVASVETGSDGVFVAHFKAAGNGTYRARAVRGATSLPYDSTPIPPERTHLQYYTG